jgi:Mannose-6-phosphate isomerase C-terminal
VPLIQAMNPTHKRFFSALANQGKIPLELIEVQTGSYLGEDDIERIEDIYKRD